jgi:hypothetical protein
VCLWILGISAAYISVSDFFQEISHIVNTHELCFRMAFTKSQRAREMLHYMTGRQEIIITEDDKEQVQGRKYDND